MRLTITNILLSAAVVMVTVAGGPTGTAKAQGRDPLDPEWGRLSEMAGPCGIHGSGMHVLYAAHEVPFLLGRMLSRPPGECNDIAGRARARLVDLVGRIERADANPRLLLILAHAATEGLGGPRDAALAERAERVAWLFEDRGLRRDRSAPTLARQRWLEQPATIALLEARVASPLASPGPQALLAQLSLRRDLPSYNPARAATLLESEGVSNSTEERLALAHLLSDGRRLPPDYGRAGEAMLWDLQYHAARVQPIFLALGRTAVAEARSQPERVAAVRLFWAAAMDRDRAATAALGRAIVALGPVPRAELTADDRERIRRAMSFHISTTPGISSYERGDDPQGRVAPIAMEALIRPDGRLALVRLLNSSGRASVDRDLLSVWAFWGRGLDLSETARGRLVWTRLPTIPSPRRRDDAYGPDGPG